MPIYTGKTIEEAKQAAGAALGVPVDQLTIKVLQEPRRGFLGTGRRPAQISAEPIAAHKPKAAKEVKTPASSAPVKSAAAQAPAKPAAAAGDDLDPAVIKARHAANLKKVRTAGD